MNTHQYARSLIEASLDPLITISLEGKITDMNEAFMKITSETRDHLTGTNFFEYFTDPQKAREVYNAIFLNGFVASYPLTIKDHKLTEVLFNGSVYRDEDGNVIGAVVVARDITIQNRISKDLNDAKLHAELATEIAEEAKTFAEKATITAENAVKSKQQFLSNMSHEIRTPMNAIIGFTKVLLKTDLSAKQTEYLKAIKLSGDALIVLINDILDLAKVDAGKMKFEKTPFKLALSISAMLHLFEPKIQEKNLLLVKEYDHNIPQILSGDPVRLHQIILNLVSNAVKFTSHGQIMVSVKLLEEDSEKVLVEFAIGDTGIGIAEDSIERIFEHFQQASSLTSRLYGGTGLGLAIVKQLVESQGGKISVDSVLGEGSVFKFVMSFEKTTESVESEITSERIGNENLNISILVVEDMALNQLLMKTILEDYGFGCEIAENGKIAVEKLSNNSYDLVLMDLQMPEMNGFEATDYIRNKMNSDIPIIALTADVTTVDLAKCKAVGMNDYVAKPIDEILLYNKILACIHKKTLGMELNQQKIILEKKLINLDYLNHRTKSNPALMKEMIEIYLEQTPSLIDVMKKSLLSEDWFSLHAAAHKLIPSFSIVGIHQEFADKAKKIQEYASVQLQKELVHELISELDMVCAKACKELKIEIEMIQTKTNGKQK